MNATLTSAPLTAADIDIVVLHGAREVLLVPDDVARRMEAERRDGWTERGIDGGESRWFERGTWMYTTISTLMRVYGDSTVSDDVDPADAYLTIRDRQLARTRCELWPSIVGRSDWDTERTGWRDYDSNTDLHVFGSISAAPGDDAYRITA